MTEGRLGRVSDRINGERLVLLGWPCAILMQVAHPLVAAGVARHSSFRDSPTAPIRRLHHTVRAMLGLTFGDADEQARVIATIRDIHTRVHGTLGERVGRFAADARYSAEDPALVLWVHVTLIATTVRVYDALVGTLTPGERDQYCRESAPVAVALGADDLRVPRDWRAVTDSVDAMLASGDLIVGREAHALARALLHAAIVRAIGPAGWAQRELTAAWLPPALRAQYGLAWDERRARRSDRIIKLIRGVRRGLPGRLARWAPARHS